MRWRGRRESSNVEDVRGSSGGGFRIPTGRGGVRRAGGGSTIGLIIFGLIAYFVFGINPLALLSGGDIGDILGGGQSPQITEQRQSAPGVPGADDETSRFVRVVLADTEDIWTKIFADRGAVYQKPVLQLFSGQTRSACGAASSATGPFYCPADSKVYIDLNFYDELHRRFKAPGDFAQAYVLAHEVGHHVQNLIGVLPEFNRRRAQMSQAEQNAMSVRVELQADCFAGIWANYAADKGYVENGDIEEAMNAAQQIGDDTIQRRSQGYVVPESFNHGTAAQRKRWFDRGLQTGKLEACDTFNTAQL
ncbi:MAG: neutral zinc metallopeptidase [Rhizobiales bacterium]|nr:neutral zinc metallopeptidase [Hyphomicrobiales bacterium]